MEAVVCAREFKRAISVKVIKAVTRNPIEHSPLNHSPVSIPVLRYDVLLHTAMCPTCETLDHHLRKLGFISQTNDFNTLTIIRKVTRLGLERK